MGASNLMTPDQILNAQLEAVDPETCVMGMAAPVLSVLLFKVCGNDQAKFDEACRLIDIIVYKVLEKANEQED